MSTTKGLVAIIAAMLMEQGDLDPNDPVSRVWPEFGVTDPVVRELLEEVQSIPDMAEFLNTAERHQMGFGGAGGIASARSVAKIYAATVGEVDGIGLISRAARDAATWPRTLALGPVAPLAAVPTQRLADFALGF